MIESTESTAIAEISSDSPVTEPSMMIVDLLATRWPEYAVGIRSSERISGALTAAESATPLSSQEIVDRISDRELATAQRPVDVLVSRCLVLIRDMALSVKPEPSPEAIHEEPASMLEAEVVADPLRQAPTSRIETVSSVSPDRTSLRKRARSESNIAIPVGADAKLVSSPFEGHRYITVIGSAGGVGSTTVTVLLGNILSLLRSDNVSAVDAAHHGGALAFRAGTESKATIADLLSAEANIRSMNDLGEYIDRLPTRLGIAKSLPGDTPMQADDYRRTVDVLARHFDVLITDIGTATSSDAAGPAIGLADLVVVVTNPTEHGMSTSARAFDALEAVGVGPERTILVVNGVHRRSAIRTDRFVETFGARCAAHMWLRWDQHLAAGSAVSLSHAHRSTIKSVVRLGAGVVQSMSPTLRLDETALATSSSSA
jgi:MinD-like ATPase involved in chromosome partitioning or flagellar assembly